MIALNQASVPMIWLIVDYFDVPVYCVLVTGSFEITFSYKFGGLSVEKPKKPKKTINNDDLKEGSSNSNNN